MNTQHTPERWFVSEYHHDVVVNSDGIRVAMSYGDNKVQEADRGRLIAAAPELLDALIHIVDALAPRDWERIVASIEEAKSAIAKATGGEV